jgi:hypothetical protein
MPLYSRAPFATAAYVDGGWELFDASISPVGVCSRGFNEREPKCESKREEQ